MDVLELTLAVYESADVEAAIRWVADSLSRGGDSAAAIWLPPAEGDPVAAGELTLDSLGNLLPEIRGAVEPMSRPLSEEETGGGGGLRLVVVPLGGGGGVLGLVGPEAALGPETSAWAPVAGGVAAVAERDRTRREARELHAKVERLEAAQKELRKSVEEGEVLHTLGLAANRSLDSEEVLELVTRLTRTALGSSYVMLSTSEGETTRTPAAAGLRGASPERDPLADRVITAGRMIRIGAEEALRPDDFPPHAEEGMLVGLGVPLSIYGETIGAIVIGYRRAVEITPRHVRLALTLAGHAAVAISNARLHQALARRTAEAEHAYDELRWAAEAKERFFASLSHELRTPLNAILGYHSLILEGVAGEVPASVETFVRNAHRAASGLLHLVNDVLDLSKIEAGKVDLTIEPVKILDLLQDALAAVRPMADQKGIRLTLAPEMDDPVARTDANRVRQIVVNLLSNAIKFTDQGEVRVRVAVAGAERSDDGSSAAALAISVRDTGPGIAQQDQKRIFQEFEQIGSAGNRGGTGLGLPISHKLARLLGGDLTLESSPGAGSVFTLTLPVDGRLEKGMPFAAAVGETPA